MFGAGTLKEGMYFSTSDMLVAVRTQLLVVSGSLCVFNYELVGVCVHIFFSLFCHHTGSVPITVGMPLRWGAVIRKRQAQRHSRSGPGHTCCFEVDVFVC